MHRIVKLSLLAFFGDRTQSLDKRPECDYSRVQMFEECPTRSVVDWEAFGEELYKARAMVFRNDSMTGRKTLRDIIKLVTVTYGFHVGFECPLAVTSALYSLALHMAKENKFQIAQALLFMGFVFVRDKGFYDCAPWPVMGWDMLLAGRFVNEIMEKSGSRLFNLNVSKDIVIIHPSKIAIVSVCAYAEDSPIKSVSRENHVMYASRHGYDIYHFENEIDIVGNDSAGMYTKDRNPFFWKVNAVQNVMDSHQYAWILWLDCDAFFMDPVRTIDSIIEMHQYQPSIVEDTCFEGSLYCGGGISVDLIITVDSTGINNGVWLIRTSEWAKNFLSQWWRSDILQGMGKAHNCSDQSTMQYELLHDNMIMAIDRVIQNSTVNLPYSLWPSQVRVAPQEYLQSFHQATAESVISREWQPGDFIKHHPGCHYYKKACQDMFFSAHNQFLDRIENATIAKLT